MRMVELEPELFLSGPQCEVDAQVAAAETLLRTSLEGADIEAMLVEDPALLFENLDSLQAGARLADSKPVKNRAADAHLLCTHAIKCIQIPCSVSWMQVWQACTSSGS